MGVSLDQLAVALKNADAAGDTVAATKLAGAIKSMQGASSNLSTDFADTSSDRPQMQPAMQTAASAAAPSMSWSDVGRGAVANALPSAGRFVSDVGSAVMHPVQTAQNIGNLMSGAIEKLVPGQQPEEKYADAVGQYFANRYGGVDNLKKTMATDPVGFLADLSTVLTGGETAAAKIPGLAKAADVAGTASRVIDPVNAAAQGVKLVGRGVGKAVAGSLGVSTGAGATPFVEAAKAGFTGGEAAKAFTDNMRGNVPMESVIADAQGALNAVKQQRSAAYNAGMTDLAADPTVLDFSKIDQALAQAKPVKQMIGKSTGVTVNLSPSVQKTAAEIGQVLQDWRNLPPQDFHTAEGFDALKQRLGDIQVEPRSPSEALKTQVYNIVKNQVTQQAPTYAKTMAGYAKASDLIKEIEGTLSLNRNARVDTQLRKLQSVMRDNVNTNYGSRADLVKLLQANGAKHIMAKLAGQSLSSVAPRGLARIAPPVEAMGGAAALAMNPVLAAPIAGALATSSPRLMGEAAYGAGKLARLAHSTPVRPAGIRSLYELQAALGTQQP